MGHFQCDVCMKQFAYKQAFDRHILTHDLEKILYSTNMNPVNMNNTELDHSARKVIPALKATLPKISQDLDRHPCDQCEKSYKRKDHLTRHKLYHTGVRAFACDVCSKTFIRKDKLQRHERTHTGNTLNNIICSVCHKMFNRKDSLTKHMKMHNGSTVNKSTSTQCDQQSQEMSNMVDDDNKTDFDPTLGQTNRFIQQIIQQEYGHEDNPAETKGGEGVIPKQEPAKSSQAEMGKNHQHGTSQMSVSPHPSMDKASYQQNNTQLPMSSHGEMEKIHQQSGSPFPMLSHAAMGKIYQQGNSQMPILSHSGMQKIHQQGNSEVLIPSHRGLDKIHQQGNSLIPMSESNRQPNPMIYSNRV